MRSRLEAGYASWLDSWGFDWAYEPQAFASADGQYLPDFHLRTVAQLVGGRLQEIDVFVEVKSVAWDGDRDALARRMEIIWKSVPWGTCDLVLEVPGRPPMAVVGLGEEGPRWTPMAWAYDVHGTTTPNERLVLVSALGRDHQPWPHGFWDGPS